MRSKSGKSPGIWMVSSGRMELSLMKDLIPQKARALGDEEHNENNGNEDNIETKKIEF